MSEHLQYNLINAELLDAIRNRLMHVSADPYTGSRIFFENAGGSLRLKSVCEAAFNESAIPDNEGRVTRASGHVAHTIQKGREDARLFFGARSGQIVSAQTTTQVIFRVVRAIAENVAGTNIVTTNLEHPSTFDSTQLYAESLGKEWRVAQLNPVTGGVDVDAVLGQIDTNTSLLAIIHASNITGTVVDIAQIIREARKINSNIFIVVDGTQHAPHAPVDVEALGCDAYFFAPYKILGKVGIGFGWIADRVVELPHDRLLGKGFDNWDLGTQEHAAYACWTQVIEYLSWLGRTVTTSPDRRTQIVAAMTLAEQHERALLTRTLYGTDQWQGLLSMAHVTLYGFADNLSSHDCVLAFNIANLPAQETTQRYLDAGIAVHSRVNDAYSKHVLNAFGLESVVRYSAMHYNTPTEVDRFLEVTASLTA